MKKGSMLASSLKMGPDFFTPDLPGDSCFMQVAVKGLAIVKVIFKCRLQHFVWQLQLAQAFCHSFVQLCPNRTVYFCTVESSWCFRCQFATICSLLRMVSCFRSGERGSLQKIRFMALTSSSARWAKRFLHNFGK